MLVGLAVGVVSLVFAGPKLVELVDDLLSPNPAGVNFEIVVDRSAQMDDPFGAAAGRRRLDAAVDEIDEFVTGRDRGDVALALRSFGAECGAESELTVGWDTSNGGSIRDALDELEPAGEPNLVSAVVEAIGDFSESERFPAGSTQVKKVVVFTGSSDCRPDAAERIRRAVEGTGIRLDFTFIGIRVPEEERDELRAVAEELEGAEALFADTEAELAAAVDWLHFDVVFGGLAKVNASFSAFDDRVIPTVEELQGEGPPFAALERRLTAAETTLERSKRSLAQLETQAVRPRFARLHELLNEGNGIHVRMLDAAQQMLALRREALQGGGESGFRSAIGEWNGLLRAHGENIDATSALIGDLEAEVPAVEG